MAKHQFLETHFVDVRHELNKKIDGTLEQTNLKFKEMENQD
jgi:hypothetical protein